MNNLVLYRDNRITGQWLIQVDDLVEKFWSSKWGSSVKEGFRLERGLLAFISEDLSSTFLIDEQPDVWAGVLQRAIDTWPNAPVPVGGLVEQYLARNHGDRTEAACDIAHGLMRDDPDKLKTGYTAENALIAVSELMGLSHVEQSSVASRIGADPAVVSV